MNHTCPNCGATIGEEIGGKLGLGAAAALLGSRVSPAAALLFGLIGAFAGHILIDAAIRKCPQCGLVFNLADALL